MTPKPTPTPTDCVDDLTTSNSDTVDDDFFVDCSIYRLYPFVCGSYDDADFTASEQCCACGGGLSSGTQAPTAEPTHMAVWSIFDDLEATRVPAPAEVVSLAEAGPCASPCAPPCAPLDKIVEALALAGRSTLAYSSGTALESARGSARLRLVPSRVAHDSPPTPWPTARPPSVIATRSTGDTSYAR